MSLHCTTNIEESEKIYFCEWFDNYKVRKKVKEINLEKTKQILRTDAYLMCKKKNISSCWTDDEEKATEYFLPK
jgi:hypothetical protein